jgi:hypothetical protein
MNDSSERVKIVRIIRKTGVFSGSRRFGVATEKSDYDYVISKKDFDRCLGKYIGDALISWIQGSGGEEEFFDNYKIMNNGRSYDIIVPYNDEDYIAWVDATENTSNVDKKFLTNKLDRIRIFEMFRMLSVSIQKRRTK